MAKTFIFDIDHTLYPYTEAAEHEITQLIDAYLTESFGLPLSQAQAKREDYYELFGTTLAGLLYYDNIEAADYLHYKDRFRLDILEPDETALTKIRASQNRHIAITNSHKNHGRRVLDHLNLSANFEKIYAIEDMGFWGKPFRKSFDKVFTDAQINPEECVFFEDSARNLAYPKRLGMTTILVNQHSVEQGQAPAFVDHHVSTLNEAMEVALAL